MLKGKNRPKNKNFKQLSLSDHGRDPNNERARDDDAAGMSSMADALVPGGRAESQYQDNMLHEHLSSLEIGLELQLDLRTEDLETLQELGSGNGGTVSKVLHVPTKTVMAKKVIRVEAKAEVRKQILRELQIMHDCNSPYIISFYGAFMNGNDIYMCMEFMDCGSLDKIVKKQGPIKAEMLSKITVAGLDYLYSIHRIIHRDVKPSNVLVNSHGQIKLCDFGVSGELINSIADTFVGTSFYMSPERIQGATYSVKSDVWSLGITLIELALGQSPYTTGKSAKMSILDLLQQIVMEDPPELPAEYGSSPRSFVRACTTKDVASRPTLTDLKSHDYFLSGKESNVDVRAWAQSLAH